MHDITHQRLGERLIAAEQSHHSEHGWGDEPTRLLLICASPAAPDMVTLFVGPWEWSVFIGAPGMQAPGATGDVEHDLGLLADNPARLDIHLADHEFLAVGLLHEWAHPEAGELHDQRCLAAADRDGGLWHVIRHRGESGIPPQAHLMIDDQGCVLAPTLAKVARALSEAYPLRNGRQW
ncbi:hypothetical protein [Nonomuraea sp. SYSU D8015]|uniref:hypothetical protein n=1 Tax=Nonomuraea sp. SYSU D8015 TaxID=2593644 RepID=UPI00166077A0|nr:hypothetical protein [Nonomuraea sp. SYSU D8015]